MSYQRIRSEYESTNLETLTVEELDKLDNDIFNCRPMYTNEDPERAEWVCQARSLIKGMITAKDPEFYNRRDDERVAAHIRKITNPAFMKRRREYADEIGEPAYGKL